MTALLEVRDLTKRFGGLVAVNNVSFSVEDKEILSVIGPNGAGKSTLFKLIASFLRTTSGEVLFKNERISNLAPHTVARKGVVRTFQETTIFRSMTVRENVVIAHHLRSKTNLAGYFFGTATARADEEEFGRSADEIIGFLGLGDIRDELASNLPQGHLRALGIAICLATGPAVLLLDEPFAGMNHDETMRTVELVRGVRDRGRHRSPGRTRHARRDEHLRPYCRAQFRREIAEGTPAEIQENERVIEAYLGSEDDAVGI